MNFLPSFFRKSETPHIQPEVPIEIAKHYEDGHTFEVNGHLGYTDSSIGFITSIGVNNSEILIRKGYIENSEVYAVINKIKDTIKAREWIVEKPKQDGTYIELQKTTIHELMRKPNASKQLTWNDIEEMLVIYLLCAGDAYVVGNTQFDKRLIEEIDILPPQNVFIQDNNNFFFPEIKYQFNYGGTTQEYSKEEVCHLKFFNPSMSGFGNSNYGLSPLQVAAKVIETSNERWDANNSIFKNRGVSSIIYGKDGNRPMSAEEAKAINNKWHNDTAGTKKFGKVHVTNKELGLIELGMSPADLQLLENGVITLRAFCNVLSVDSTLFNDPENKTYANRQEAERSLYTNAVMPLSDKIAEYLTNYLCENHFPGQGVRMRQDFSKVECLQENFKDKVASYCLMKNSGVISANVAAEALEQPVSTDENADKLIISNGILVEQIDATQVAGQTSAINNNTNNATS